MLLGGLVPALLGVTPAYSQGFMVQPMIMQANPSPANSIDLPLKINNTAVDGPRTVDLRLVDLSQDEQGVWRLVENGSGIDLAGHESSLPWTSLSATRVEIKPDQPASVTVTLKPPSSARGFYFAGIVVETPIPDNPVGVVVRTRFFIPLIIEIRGRSVRQQVALSDVSMAFQSDPGLQPTTIADMVVSNKGQTYSRVRGELTIESQSGKQWRVVTRVPVYEKGIIPGVTLKLGGDLERRLPSGTYRLRADLFVDGRRVSPLERVIQFVGDPKATVAFDSTLVLKPGSIDLKVAPGATRTAVLAVENASDDPVKIEMSSRTPRGLVGVQMGDVVGAALSAEPWTKIEPSSFTLRPGGRQNVRVFSSVPADGVTYPNYYADLVLAGTYADGQSAGETVSTIHLANAELKSTPQGQIEKLSLAEGDDSKFVVQLVFDNIGDVDFVPQATAILAAPSGAQLASVTLAGDTQTLLPLGRRSFSGEMDFSNLEPGEYKIVASIRSGNTSLTTQAYPVTVGAEQFVGPNGATKSVPTVDLAQSDGASGANVDASMEGDVALGK